MPGLQKLEPGPALHKVPPVPKDRETNDLPHESNKNSALKELLAVIIFASVYTLLMVHLQAFESLYRYTRSFEHYSFGEIAVFLPSFLAIGFVLYSYRRIEELKTEITKRLDAENKLQESEIRYKKLSITDDLTQLYNSRFFYSKLNGEIARSLRYLHPLSLLLIDIDDFKKLNDRYGHLKGDDVLSAAGKILRDCIRETDSAYRYGGEEFTVILPETEFKDAMIIAERIKKKVATQVFYMSKNNALHITVSIGVCQLNSEEEMNDFIKRADIAMYRAKQAGKNRVSP